MIKKLEMSAVLGDALSFVGSKFIQIFLMAGFVLIGLGFMLVIVLVVGIFSLADTTLSLLVPPIGIIYMLLCVALFFSYFRRLLARVYLWLSAPQES